MAKKNSVSDITNQTEFETALTAYLHKIFDNMHSMYDSSGVLNKAILNKFEIAFVTRYLNYAIGYENQDVFIQKLYDLIMTYSNYLFNITDEYEDLFNAAVQINRSVTRTRSFENSDIGNRTTDTTENSTGTQNGTSKNSGTDNLSGTNTGTVKENSSSTAKDSGTNNTTGTQTGTVDENGSGSSTNRGRVLNTDYPQSSVNINMDFPLTGQFNYASTGEDNTSKGSTTDDKLTTNDLSSTNNNTVDMNNTASGESTTTNDLSSSNNRTIDMDNTTSSNTSLDRTVNVVDKDKVDRTGNESEDVTYEDDTISPFERTKQLMELIDKYKFSPLYKVLGYAEKLFLAKFVDEERYCYVTPSFISNMYKGV